MAGTEAQLNLINFEKRAAEFLKHPFQVRHRDILVDGKALDLMEHRRVRLVIVTAINSTGRNHADRRALGLHRADLHGRGMGAQNMRRTVVALGAVHKERVVLLARGVLGRDVQGVKVVPIALDLGTFGHGKAHVGENRGDLFGHLADGVDRALTARTHRQRNVQPFAAQAFLKRGIGQSGLFTGKRAVDLVLERVEGGTCHLTFLRGHLAQLAHLQADLALFADGLQAQLFQRAFVGGVGDGVDVFLPQVIHWASSNLSCCALCYHRAIRIQAARGTQTKKNRDTGDGAAV